MKKFNVGDKVIVKSGGTPLQTEIVEVKETGEPAPHDFMYYFKHIDEKLYYEFEYAIELNKETQYE